MSRTVPHKSLQYVSLLAWWTTGLFVRYKKTPCNPHYISLYILSTYSNLCALLYDFIVLFLWMPDERIVQDWSVCNALYFAWVEVCTKELIALLCVLYIIQLYIYKYMWYLVFYSNKSLNAWHSTMSFRGHHDELFVSYYARLLLGVYTRNIVWLT